MFEFDKYEAAREGGRTTPAQAYQPAGGVGRRALLLWGEHCIECAAPDCYTSCDLYDPRPDERCRRFKYGAYRNPDYPTGHGTAAEVIFKKWGKIEARGNATMIPADLCTALERSILAALPLLNRIGRGVRKWGGSVRWSYISFGALERFNRWLAKRRNDRVAPDAFLAEIYNPGTAPVSLVFNMWVACNDIERKLPIGAIPVPYVRLITIEPGYNRIDIPAAEIAPIYASGLPFNMALIPNAGEGAHLVFLRLDLVTYAPAAPQPVPPDTALPSPDAARPAAKCVVFDLDNTLWDGVLLEGDVDLRRGVKELFAELDARGILISVASKNGMAPAMAQLQAFGLHDYLLFPQINWGPKSASVAAIAQRLGIGLDTVVFVDDSAFEREEVARARPEVETLTADALEALSVHPRLQGGKTAEARGRRAMYRQALERDEAAVTFGDDYLAFLRSCEIVLQITPVTEAHVERVVELVQRTNQLNFSGRKYSREEIQQILATGRYDRHVLVGADKFGDYGVVGFALSRPIDGGVRLEDFMLSCRVQGKFMEQALFDYLLRRCPAGPAVLEINFVSTARNGPAAAVLRKLGFDLGEGGSPLRRVFAPGELAMDFITVRETAGPEAD